MMWGNRLILQYLIPIRLLRGLLPHPMLLKKYPALQLYTIITDCIRTGDLAKFDDLMSTHERYFIAKGTYLIVEKLRSIVIRVLFKKT
jgi:hypothetical protein